ncbi:cell filamentation protein Fic [Tissierella sp. P1]|uniref:Fic/DOC family protein n=1 Tax=Tissierella sp. P1 TaxID=1280483 RepID=UPI000BA184F1|nr:Fic family protein [Tissierella sp. P1]OZV13478.1 cell filamentation protein Fic [Tissierella sp. P1]
MKRDYDYTYEWDSRYCYPNSFVLRNKLNITNREELDVVERKITSLRMAEISKKPVRGNFDLKHLQDIHRHIFKDIYEWAGELRTVNISKGNTFYNQMYISDGFKDIFSKLRKEKFLIGTVQEDIAGKLAYYLSEINVIHPFREGNGRTQRIMIEYLAQVAGYDVDFYNISQTEMVEASVASFNCDYIKMIEIFKKITSSITKQEQESFINQISTINSPVLRAYQKLNGINSMLEDKWELEK